MLNFNIIIQYYLLFIYFLFVLKIKIQKEKIIVLISTNISEFDYFSMGIRESRRAAFLAKMQISPGRPPHGPHRDAEC
jgi:hypothetical protein